MRNEHEDATRVERVDPLVGSVLDNRYRIDFRLAAGGFGAIYRATHIKTGREVALKVLHTELATNDARVIARFRREGDTLRQLRDRHTITAYEIGEDPDGALYIVMELLHGESLYEVYRAKGPLPWQRMVSIARMVCSSLGEAHALGIVHRDLKPANIHLEPRDGNPDFVKVLDFGIAKILRDSELDSTELTQAGQMIGTFDYMAPEQMVGGQCTAATDIYTLGVVMFEMIAGRRPFMDANSPTAMLAALLTQTAPLLSELARVPRDLDRVLARCLEREPQNRYANVEELAADLERLDESATRRMAATPPPELHMSDEVTVIDTRRTNQALAPERAERAKRDSTPPHVIRREGSSPAIKVERAKRDSSPPDPRARRDSSPPDPRARRDSSPPPAPYPDPYAQQRVPTPPGVVIQQRVPTPPGVPIAIHQPGSAPIQQVPHAVSWYPPQHPNHPGYGAPQFPSTHGNQGRFPAPQAPYPQPPVRPSHDVQTYELSASRDRDVLVRWIVWAIAIALGLVLVIVVASRL